MSPVWGAVKIVAGILGWMCLIAIGASVVGLAFVVVADWYRMRRRRRQQREAQAATRRARQERLLAERDRELLAAMESQFSSEGEEA